MPCYLVHNNTQDDNGNGITIASNGKIWFTEYPGVEGTARIGHSQ